MNHAWDHTDEADVILLGPLNVFHPHLKNLDEEAAAARAEAARRLGRSSMPMG